jgi:hypothetical protein
MALHQSSSLDSIRSDLGIEKTAQSSASEQPKFSTPEEEVAYLRQQIAEREAQLQQGNYERSGPTAAHERGNEAAAAVTREYQASPAENVLHNDYQTSEQEIRQLGLELEPEEHDWQMAELVKVMQQRGIKNALSVVDQLDNPHVEDDFHRFLVQYLKGGYQIQGLKDSMPLYRALHMTLYEVVLPPANDESDKKELKNLVSSMEQVFAGLLPHGSDKGRIREYFSFEIAVSHVGEEISFYCAVPDARRGLFERQVQSIFTNARIEVVKNDYNVFNDEGVTVGSTAQVDDEAAFPLKTYDEFDHDPLSVILNAFSKLAEVGEGCAIQVIFREAPESQRKSYEHAMKQIERGEDIKDAINTSLVREFWKVGKDVIKDVISDPDKDDSKDETTEAQARRQASIEALQKKIASPLSHVNIRIVVSAPTRHRAGELLTILKSAFRQFENPLGNEIAFRDVNDRRLDEFLHQYSFRLFNDKQAMPLNLTELSTLYHFPVRSLEGAREIKEQRSVTAPAPIDMPKDGILLGVNKHRGTELDIHMTPKDRVRHMYVIGQTGTGKSVMLTNMILQDIQAGEGCCFIDPHGSDVQYILSNIPPHRYEDVIYFDPSHLARPMALNMLEYDELFPEQKTFVINELLGIFNKLFDMKTAGGPMFEQYFRNATGLVMEDPASGNTLLDISRVLADEQFRKDKLAKSNNFIVNQFWNEIAGKAGGEASLENIVPYITSKFDGFLSNDYMRPIIAQEQSSLKFREIMDDRKILLVNLAKGRLGDINSNLLGLIIVGKITMAAMSRVDSFGQDLPPFYLYIDEFQNVTTDSIAVILSEARKYNLGLIAAHQYIKQLEESIRNAVFGNVGSMAVFRVSTEDAEVFEKMLGPIFSQRDIANIPNWNAYMKMLAVGTPVKPFSMATLPPPEGSTEHLDALKELSYLKFGRPRSEVEAEIKKRYEKKAAGPDPFAASPFF